MSELVYKWSEDKMFIQVLTEVTVPAGSYYEWPFVHTADDHYLSPGHYGLEGIVVGYGSDNTEFTVENVQLSVSLTLEGISAGSTSFRVIHRGGDTIPDAFATENLYKMDVRINGRSVTTMAGVTFKLNGVSLTPGDFVVGDVLEIIGIPPLALGDTITVIYKPTNQILLEIKVMY